MQQGIGPGRTREDHHQIANRLYKYYAKGRDLRGLEAIVGREGMSTSDKNILEFADTFEQQFVSQGNSRRDIGATLDGGLAILKQYGLEEL